MTKRKVAQAVFIVGFSAISLLAFWLGTHFAQTAGERLRGPAAVPRAFDFSHLQGPALQQASIRQILSGARVVTAGNLSGVQLGHFTLRSPAGVSVSVCDLYPTIKLKFVAGDMAVSGDSPEMEVTGHCSAADAPGAIEPLLVDYMAVKKTNVTDKALRQPQAQNNSVKFKNVSDTWPRVWILNSIQFVPAQADSDGITIVHEQIRENLGKNVALEW